MNRYELKDHGGRLKAIEPLLIADLNEALADAVLGSVKYKDCELLEFLRFVDQDGLRDAIVEVSCDAGILAFALGRSISSGLLSMKPEDEAVFKSIMAEYGRLHDEWRAEQDKATEELVRRSEAEWREERDRLRWLEEHKEELRAEAERDAKEDKSRRDFAKALSEKPLRPGPDVAGWAKSAWAEAVVPAHLERDFRKAFGDVPHATEPSWRGTLKGESLRRSAKLTVRWPEGADLPESLKAFAEKGEISDVSAAAQLIRMYKVPFHG